MKKIRLLLVLICLFSLLMLVLSSCGAKLTKPTGLYLDIDTQTLTWNKVKGAKFYTIQISGVEGEITTNTNSVSLEHLDPGIYDIKVQANSDSQAVNSSAFAKYDDFERYEESGLKYQLINNDTEYELVGAGSASGVVVMENTFRDKPVTSIAEKALYHNTKITSFTVGDNVKKIGAKAFTKCSALEEIIIKNSVTSIGEYAFQSCKELKSITLPNSITTVSSNLFAWCSGLEKVTLGKNVTLIDEYAFSGCSALKTITYADAEEKPEKVFFPASLEYIAAYAFADCTSLLDVTIGDNVVSIAPYAFSGNTALTKVDFGNGLAAIEDCAFFACTSLATISISDSIESIGNYAFYRCTALNNVSLGTGLRYIGSQAFFDTQILNSAEGMLLIDGWLIQVKDTTIDKFTLNNEAYGVASYAFSGCNALTVATLKGVKYLGVAAFADCKQLYDVTFDDALLDLGDYAFYGCEYLYKITLGESITTIGNYAFTGCKALAKISIPKSVTYIGTRAFRNSAPYVNKANSGTNVVVYVDDWAVDYISDGMNAGTVMFTNGTRGIAAYAFSGQALRHVSMPDTLEYICKGAFYKSTASSVSLSKSLKYIDDYAFYECIYANFGGDTFTLTIPEGTSYIGRSAFYKCSYILTLNVPGTVQTIGPYAFYGCENIGATVNLQEATGEKDEEGNDIFNVTTLYGKLNLSEGILAIGDRAFQGCKYMISASIPNSVIYLGTRAFYKCETLNDVTIGSGITKIEDYTFYKCSSLTTVTISDKLEVIGNYAFRGCASLSEFNFSNIKTIGRYAFYGCASLSEIVFPRTLTSIGDYAFRGCSAATSIVLGENIETIGKHAFYALNETTIYAESDPIMPYWSGRFNSSYRPVFWGCTLSEDGSYVVSVKVGKDNLKNPTAVNGIKDPARSGYDFLGWATESGSTTVAYTSQNVNDAPEGTVLFAIWAESTPSAE